MEKIRIIIQVVSSPEKLVETSPLVEKVMSFEGFSMDKSYSPQMVTRPKRQISFEEDAMSIGFGPTYPGKEPTSLVRGEFESREQVDALIQHVQIGEVKDIVGIFSDPLIQTMPPICPGDPPEGDHKDVFNLLDVADLHGQGLDGNSTRLAIVDTGINVEYLTNKGVNVKLDANNSWAPPSSPPGNMPGQYPVDHGTMCTFDALIAAPEAKILDIALLQTQRAGDTVMSGFLSDAIIAYNHLLNFINTQFPNNAKLIVSNSWGMFHPDWDFPPTHPSNYSDNPNHPFNLIVESLAEAGADILFAAGNCGSHCPDGRCRGVTEEAIYGANSHDLVTCVAGIDVKKNWVGYSSEGPGRLNKCKPDIAAYTHFKGSEVYEADGGTSAACPVAAGIVAALRSKHSAAEISPIQMRAMLCKTAKEKLWYAGHSMKYGFGIIDPFQVISKYGDHLT